MSGQDNIRRAGESGNPPLRVVTKAASDRLDRVPEDNDVWVWSIALSSGPLPSELTEEEKARAERYKVVSARQQFAIGRAWLRRLFGGYLQLPPNEVPITYSAAGKPILADSSTGLHFNISHSHELAVIAVATRPVGIDIEQ